MDLSELDLDAARAAIAAAASSDELAELRKRLVGKAVSEFTAAVDAALEARQSELAPAVVGDAPLDLTLGSHGRRRGHLHLVTQCQRELEDVFVSLGYRVAEGPEVEDDWLRLPRTRRRSK